MSKESFISREVFSTKFPAVSEVSVKFHYNFFVKDESINETGDLSVQARPVGASTADAIDRRALQKKISRYTIVSFKGTNSGAYLDFDNEARSGLVSQNKNKINLEGHITTNFFSSARYQDEKLREKIMSQVMRLAAISGIDLSGASEISQTDIATIVNDVTGDYISKDVLLSLIHEELFKSVKFSNQTDTITKKLYDDAQRFKTSMQIDTRFIGDIYSTNNCKLNRGIKGLQHLTSISASQAEARAASVAAINLDVDYEPDVKIINEGAEINKHIVPKVGSVGYMITKSRLAKDGKTFVENFYLDGVHNTQFIDTKVAYGQTYVYEVSSVSLVEMSIDVEEEAEEPSIRFVRYLVQSNPSRDTRIMCVEEEAPPPADAIFYRYDYDRDSLAIDWRHPITSQRDIKGFQVFRRNSINEPFALQRQYNFNDSILIYPTGEVPAPSLVEQSKYPVMSYEDLEFNRGSSYIYTVCSIDAHGYISNYGTQTRVTFDKNTNKIRLHNISQPGAPRQYPNMFISPNEAQNINAVRLTEDVIKDSMHKNMRVYFDPEHYTVVDKQNVDLKHLADDASGGVYKFEVLNLDRQKSKTLSIKLKNRRTS